MESSKENFYVDCRNRGLKGVHTLSNSSNWYDMKCMEISKENLHVFMLTSVFVCFPEGRDLNELILYLLIYDILPTYFLNDILLIVISKRSA